MASPTYNPRVTAAKAGISTMVGGIAASLASVLVSTLRSNGWSLWDPSMDTEVHVVLIALLVGAYGAFNNWRKNA